MFTNVTADLNNCGNEAKDVEATTFTSVPFLAVTTTEAVPLSLATTVNER